MGTLRFAIEEKQKGKVAEHFKAASELDSLNRLKEYLCDAAVKRGKVKPDVCRNCGAGCRYGQKYVRLWDDQQEKESKIMARTAQATENDAKLKEQLDAKMQELMGLHEANRTMMLEVKGLTEDLAEAQKALTKTMGELSKAKKECEQAKVALWRMKAKLYDMEHPEEE